MARDYTSLITSQHATRPKFSALVQTVAGGLGTVSDALAAMPGAFDLDTAVGVQLDAVGAWVGIGRYFSGSPSITLGDDDFRTLIRVKVAVNHWDGTCDQFQTLMAWAFGGGSTVVVLSDNQDMTFDVYLYGPSLSASLLAVLRSGSVVPKPAGVRLTGFYVASITSGPVFSFDANTSTNAGFDVGSWAIPV